MLRIEVIRVLVRAAHQSFSVRDVVGLTDLLVDALGCVNVAGHIFLALVLGITTAVSLVDPVLVQDENGVNMPEDTNGQVGASNLEVGLAPPQTVPWCTFLVRCFRRNRSPDDCELGGLKQVLDYGADETPNKELAAQLQAIFLQHFEKDDQIDYREYQEEVVVVYPIQVVDDE